MKIRVFFALFLVCFGFNYTSCCWNKKPFGALKKGMTSLLIRKTFVRQMLIKLAKDYSKEKSLEFVRDFIDKESKIGMNSFKEVDNAYFERMMNGMNNKYHLLKNIENEFESFKSEVHETIEDVEFFSEQLANRFKCDLLNKNEDNLLCKSFLTKYLNKLAELLDIPLEKESSLYEEFKSECSSIKKEMNDLEKLGKEQPVCSECPFKRFKEISLPKEEVNDLIKSIFEFD